MEIERPYKPTPLITSTIGDMNNHPFPKSIQASIWSEKEVNSSICYNYYHHPIYFFVLLSQGFIINFISVNPFPIVFFLEKVLSKQIHTLIYSIRHFWPCLTQCTTFQKRIQMELQKVIRILFYETLPYVLNSPGAVSFPVSLRVQCYVWWRMLIVRRITSLFHSNQTKPAKQHWIEVVHKTREMKITAFVSFVSCMSCERAKTNI